MQQNTQRTVVGLNDVCYVLFRHKWMILLFALLGLGAAIFIWFSQKPLYRSEARLIVRYVLETSAGLYSENDERIRQPDSRGEGIINSELEILTSWDTAELAAEIVGPERILGQSGLPNAKASATKLIVRGLTAKVPNHANSIRVSFVHEDPVVCRDVLKEVIPIYLQKHADLHLAGGITYDELAKQTDELKSRLRQTEEKIQKLVSVAGGVSLENANAPLSVEMGTIRKALLELESDLAEQKALLSLSSVSSRESASGDPMTLSNVPPRAESLSAEIGYVALFERLQVLREREQDYLSRFGPENPMVTSVQLQISEIENKIEVTVSDYPQIAAATSVVSGPRSVTGAGTLDTASQIVALEAKIKFLTNQLYEVQTEAVSLSDLGMKLGDLRRDKDIQEANLLKMATGLEQARFDTALRSGMLSSIGIPQQPTPPTRASNSAAKLAGMAVFGGISLGLGLAFLLEFGLDPRVKRVAQIERKISQPVYMTIPHFVQTGATTSINEHRLSQPNGAEAISPTTSTSSSEEATPALRPYCEALRDRIVIYFERINLRRKPKLIGVTGCHENAGSSTIAEGLADALSEAGGGKVLLVDLHKQTCAMRSYVQGRPAMLLPDVLEQMDGSEEDREASGLYLASFNKGSDARHPARSREFDLLLPKLKASDFDYVVFDLPPLSATSVTYRLSGLMDKTLLVAEAEKTHLDTLQSAASLLSETSSVALVLNKNRSQLPAWLSQPL